MRAIQVARYGGPDVLELVDVPTPSPGPGELLVDVRAAGVNFIDTYFRTGAYPRPTPFLLGQEGAGTVSALGDAVGGWALGDRVAWWGAAGSYAESAIVAATQAVRVPDGVSDEQAAAVLLQGMTAHYLCTSTHPVAPGEWVLVHAGAGGVGLLLTQLVVGRGGRVIATVGNPDKAALARLAGAEAVLDYASVPAEVRRLTGGDGVAVVYDGVGARTFDTSLASLRPRGLLALYGASSGPVPPVDLQRLNAGGSLFVTRPTLVNYVASRAELDWRAGEVLGAVAAGTLQVRIGASFALADAGQAHEQLEGRTTTGKVLLRPHD